MESCGYVNVLRLNFPTRHH